MKIASLIPSGTDIICALGLEKSLVCVSHCCDHAVAKSLPIATRSIVDSTKSPLEIDTDVSDAISSSESLYQTDRALLRDLSPDLVLTQTICDVCAVNSNTARASLPEGAKLLNLSATSINGLWEDIWNVATATGTSPEEIIDQLQSRLNKVKTFAKTLDTKPKVLVLEWSEPPFLGGHWVPEMIEIAGGIHLLSNTNEPSRRATWDEIIEAAPEIVILAPCGYDLNQTIEQGRGLLENSPLSQLNAQIWATNATALFSRCTPATIRGIEVVAGILGGNFGVTNEEASRLK
jgi:iron complex transport system substrate-binding protein